MNPEDMSTRAAKERDRQSAFDCRLFCCASTGCISSGSESVMPALAEAAASHGLGQRIDIVATGCMGLCAKGPLVRVEIAGREPVLYCEVGQLEARLIVAEHIRPAIDRGAKEALDLPPFLRERQLDLSLPFFACQEKVVLANSGAIDPDDINHYIAADGYTALASVLEQNDPEAVIDRIDRSGLRGRGGAGYPTGRKWRNTRSTPASERCVVCNGDEGDPGAYMDRSILEGDPHAVIEGMAIAAHAIGAQTGWFYIRAEYGLAIRRVEKAIRQARRAGLLGTGILGTGFDFDCEIRLGAGAFVCGEETALINSIEGKRGYPRPRPPYPSASGLWGRPTCVNNVETLANVAPIIRNGPEWFAGIGDPESAGTKVFAITGKVQHTGLIEVPMGAPLSTIVEQIAGGSSTGRPLKAVQTGGPSGGVIPASAFATPVSYEGLAERGSIMGSGGMIVLDADDSMVDIAAFYLEFTVEESCGKCAPCRIGGKQMLELLHRFQAGTATQDDLLALDRLAVAMQQASLCGLGQTGPNPVVSTITHFADEYRARIGATVASA